MTSLNVIDPVNDCLLKAARYMSHAARFYEMAGDEISAEHAKFCAHNTLFDLCGDNVPLELLEGAEIEFTGKKVGVFRGGC